MGERCIQGVKIKRCNLGVERDGKIRCTQKRYGDLYNRHPDMFPAGKPDSPYGECDNSRFCGMTLKILNNWRKRTMAYMKKMEA